MKNVTPPSVLERLIKFLYDLWYWTIISLIMITFMIFALAIMSGVLIIEIINWVIKTIKKIFLSLTYGY